MKRPNPEKLAAEATKWNLAHPVGTPVMRYKLIAPLREGAETKTRSAAYVMGGHSVMVMVEGVSGGVLLESLKPIGIRPDISVGIVNRRVQSGGWVIHLVIGDKTLCGRTPMELLDRRQPVEGDCFQCMASYNRRWPAEKKTTSGELT